MKSSVLSLIIFCTTAVLLMAHFVDQGKIMTPEITVPYFSGATIMKSGEPWTFNLNDVDSLKKINSIQYKSERVYAINHYRFSTTKLNTHDYSINQPGLLYLIRISSFLFPFLGQIGALKLLQLFVHILLSILILLSLSDSKKQIVFFFLYVINPFIIYLSLFPFYYFWQVINSGILVLILLNEKKQNSYWLTTFAILFALLYHVRVSTFPLSIFTLAFAFKKLPPLNRIVAIGILIFTITLLNPAYLSKHPGHVMYSSLGAYPNSPVAGFSDNISFQNYNIATGNNYSYDSKPSMYDPEVIMGEARWGLDQFILFFQQKPLIIFRNAVLNIFESFSFGYITSSLSLTYFSALLGFLFLTVLLLKRKFYFITLILVSSSSYILYLAPAPIYLFGTYILLVYVFVETFLTKTTTKFSLPEKSM